MELKPDTVQTHETAGGYAIIWKPDRMQMSLLSQVP